MAGNFFYISAKWKKITGQKEMKLKILIYMCLKKTRHALPAGVLIIGMSLVTLSFGASLSCWVVSWSQMVLSFKFGVPKMNALDFQFALTNLQMLQNIKAPPFAVFVC